MPVPDALQGLVGALMGAEGGEADVALAGGTEADAGGADDMRTVEQGFEETPGRHAVGRAHPDIGGVFATVALESEGAQCGEHPGGILHVVVNGLLNLLLALGRVDGLGSTLADIAGTIELGTLTTQPQLVQRDTLALEG